MHYQVFLPHATRNTQALQNVGLSVIADGVFEEQIPRGPTNEPGLLCGWMTNKGFTRLIFDPPSQDWLPAVADGEEFPAGRYWVGCDRKSPPKPDELQRRYPYRGTKVHLGPVDIAQEWIVPRAESLPFDMLRADDGSTRFVPQQKFHAFAQQAEEWSEVFQTAQPGGRVTFTALRDFVELGLQANYRLIPEVSDYLHLWSSGESGTVFQAALAICAPDMTEAHDGR